MSESDATVLDSTARSNIGEGAESAGGGARAAPAEADKTECGVCGLVFPTVRGKSQHERLVHPK